ncbi:transcriptional regulator [Sedimenticola sp.]|uniref:transcriptional regulator n=1 Tax=Sedimenticola sp. TaxID=1940285 RepID=UPI003D09A416
MLIEGPMNITISDPADGQGKVLVILFTPEFQALSLEEQGKQFQDYMTLLSGHMHSTDSVDERNRAGMAIIYQFADQLLPHIISGDLALEERIVLQIRQASQAVALTDLLASKPN